MDTLSLEFDRRPTHVVIAVRGRLDGISASTFNAFAAEHLMPGDVQVTLECSDLSYVSSAGLREFLMLAKRAAQMGSKVTLAGASGTVAFTLEMAGFNALFKLVPSLAPRSANASLGDSPAGSSAQPTGLLKRLFTHTGRS